MVFGGAIVIGGGVGNLLIHSSSQKEQLADKRTNLSSVSEEPKNVILPTTPSKKCIIFVTDEAQGNKEQMTITKVLNKSEDSEEFLKGIDGVQNQSFKKNVIDACEGKKKEPYTTDTEIHVYVYQKTGGAWNYTQYIQKNLAEKGILWKPQE